MIRFSQHLQTHHPPRDAFDMLADMADLHRWNPNVSTSRRTSGSGLDPGSTCEYTIAGPAVRLTGRARLVSVEPGGSICYEGRIGPMWSTDAITFQRTATGTRVTFRNETRTAWWLRPIEPILNATFQRLAPRAVDGARRHLGD